MIATQMLSTLDGVTQGRLAFPNLINMRDLDFDFQVMMTYYTSMMLSPHIDIVPLISDHRRLFMS